jgi:hypothetical protein
MMTRTIDQQIAEAEAKLQRLKKKAKASETRRKIIVGSVVITNALNDADTARRLAALLRRSITRDVDIKEVSGLIDALDTKASVS